MVIYMYCIYIKQLWDAPKTEWELFQVKTDSLQFFLLKNDKRNGLFFSLNRKGHAKKKKSNLHKLYLLAVAYHH